MSTATDARKKALALLVQSAANHELTDAELVADAHNVIYYVGLGECETGALLVAFNDLSADEFSR